jgi:hypothetical protein
MTARHLLENNSSLSEQTQNSQLNTRKNTAKVVLGLTVVFLITYVPYYIFETFLYSSINFENFLVKVSKEKISALTIINISSIINLFPSINSCLNPVALCCTSLAFRRQFKRYLTCCCKAKSTPTDFELQERH